MREFILSKLNTSDLIRIASAIVLATLLWGWVTTREDPERTRQFPNVVVQVGELPDDLVVVSQPPPVLIELRGPRSVVTQVSANEVTASLDLDEIDSAGDFTVDVNVSSPNGVWERKAIPSRVQIHVESSITKQFTLQPQVAGDLALNQGIGEIVPDPSEVTVLGPSSIVARVDHVALPIDIGERSSDFTGSFTPIAIDSSGQQIPEVTISPSTVNASVEIVAAGKSVAVFAQLVGSPANGLSVIDQVVNPSTVLVDGPQEVLNSLVILQTEPIDISGATGNVSQRVGIAGLPEGVRIVDPAGGTVQVSVQIGQQGVRQELTGIPITVVNLAPGLQATVEPASASIVVDAPAQTLANITTENIVIQVDASGLGAGVHYLTPKVSLPSGVTWSTTNPVSFRLTIVDQTSVAASATALPGTSSPAAIASPEPLP
jgi:YbbR domain-containing protein